VLGKYPRASGYPHLYVLDAQGALLHSQNTAPLEEGCGYHHGRMKDFLKSHAPARQGASREQPLRNFPPR